MSINLMTKAWKSGSPAGQKMVLLALCDNANDQGECRPSIAYIAHKCSMGDRTVQGHISEMEKLGILRRNFRTGRSTYYFISPENFTPQKPRSRNLCTSPPVHSAPLPQQNSRGTTAAAAPRIITEPSNEPSGNQKSGRETDSNKFSPFEALTALQVQPQTAKDWIEHREARKAVVTVTVLDAIVREAESAGVSVDAALRCSCEFNWVGFRADWYLSKHPVVAGIAPARQGRASAFQQTMDSAAAAKRRLFGGLPHA